jgi:hypothetical protein
LDFVLFPSGLLSRLLYVPLLVFLPTRRILSEYQTHAARAGFLELRAQGKIASTLWYL